MSNSGSFGTMSFFIPSFLLDATGSVTQSYLNFLDSGLYPDDITVTGSLNTPTYPYTGVTTGYTGFTYYAIGGSRLQEKKLYGTGYDTSTFTSGSTVDGVDFTGYTFTYSGETMGSQTLYYADYSDGYTMITGHTTGFTQEAVFNSVLTRNEHFLGFVEQPRVYSDVFVERGKQGVMENNLRLGEIRSTGELEKYGNKYFTIKKQ
jgi:hypothetical protein